MTQEDQAPPDTSLSGQEPQLGGERGHHPISEQDRLLAAQLFREALQNIDDENWPDAIIRLRDTLKLVPDYPQARGLLQLTEEVARSEQPDPQRVNALRAFVWALLAAAQTPVSPVWLSSSAGTAFEEAPALMETETALDTSLMPASEPSAYQPLFVVQPDAVEAEGYYEWVGEAAPSIGGWVAGLLPVLPVLIVILKTVLAPGQPFAPGLLWLPVGAVIAVGVLAGWLLTHEMPMAAFVLVGGTAMIVMFFAAGTLSLFVPAVMFITMAVSYSVAVVSIRSDGVVVAAGQGSGVAMVPATVALAYTLTVLQNFAANILSGTGYGRLFVMLASYFLAGLVAIVVFMLAFSLLFIVTALPVYGIAFVIAAALDASQEGRLAVYTGVIVMLSALDLILILMG